MYKSEKDVKSIKKHILDVIVIFIKITLVFLGIILVKYMLNNEQLSYYAPGYNIECKYVKNNLICEKNNGEYIFSLVKVVDIKKDIYIDIEKEIYVDIEKDVSEKAVKLLKTNEWILLFDNVAMSIYFLCLIISILFHLQYNYKKI